MKNEFTGLDGTAQAELVRHQEVSPLELVDAAIAGIEQLNPQLNAVITPLFEKARALAQSGAIPDGPFRGVPLLLKDLGAATGGDPLYMGMRLLRDAHFVAPYDTYLAGKLKAAGFVIIGKTNTPELGLLSTTEPEAFGPSCNPWDTSRSTGGSSGGSAAAVAARMVPIAHGNDGGGSIRIPASQCGVVGLKPSRGRVSWGPDLGELVHGFVMEHVLTRSVRDSAAVLDAIAGNMPGDPYSAPPQRVPFISEIAAPPDRLRIGFMNRTPQGVAVLHRDCLAAVENAARLLESLGHDLAESHPAALDEFLIGADLTKTGPSVSDQPLANWEAFANVFVSDTRLTLNNLGAIIGRHITAQDVEPFTWTAAEYGSRVSATQYLASVQRLHAWSRRLAQWWSDGFDLLLTPTLASPAPLLGTTVATPYSSEQVLRRYVDFNAFCPAYNVTGQPAISLPLYWNSAGFPIGIQLVAAFGREDLLLRVAAQLEQALPWKDRHPPVCA
jgi:amidase